MKAINNIFHKMDEFLFKKLDEVKNIQQVQMILGKLDTLPEEYQKIANQGISFFIVLLPLLFTLVFWVGNSSLKGELEEKQQIWKMIQSINEQNAALNGVSRLVLSPFPVSSKNELSGRVSGALKSVGIDNSKVNVQNFESKTNSSGVTESEATLNFNGFATKDLTSFLTSLIDRQKLKISRINVKKLKSKNSLNGEIGIIHFGKQAK